MFYTEKEQKEIWDKQYQAYVKETTEKNESLEAGKEAEEIKTFEDWSKAKKVQTKEIKDLGEFTNGYAFMKFTNVCSDGTIPNKSEERRAMAVALEQEMKAKAEEARANVIQAEAEVPKAMAEAFRSGNLGIMDYYRMKNIQADTDMRTSIAQPEGGSSNIEIK